MAGEANEKDQLFAFVIGVWLCVILSLGFSVYSSGLFDGAHKIQLDDRINPNVDPPASLVRLPGVGIVRAEAIVAYREDFVRNNGGKISFKTFADLQKVRGIGPGTVKSISQWLKFE